MTLLFKFLYRVYRTISSFRYWGYRRFTPAGLAILGSLVITGIFSIDSDNNVAYQGFSFLLLLLIVAFGSSFLFRARFAATRQLPRFGTVGIPLTYTVALRNQTTKAQNGLALVE